MADLYPMKMVFSSSAGPIQVCVRRDGWAWPSETARARFHNELPVAERLNLRRSFEAQVELAKATPTKHVPS